MKHIKKILSLILIMSTLVLCLASCFENGDEVDEENGIYYVFGLHYELGPGYTKINVPYSENCYTNGNTYFFFSVFSGAGLEEIEVAADISVEIFMQKFLVWNYQDPFIYEYDKKKDMAYAHYLSSDQLVPEEAGESEPEYFYTVVLRGHDHLYVVHMSCKPDEFETYRAHFEDIRDSLDAS